MTAFNYKPIPILKGKVAKRFVEMAERNERKYKGIKRVSDDTIKNVMEKQERYLNDKPNIKEFKLSVYTKEELEVKRSKAWKPIM